MRTRFVLAAAAALLAGCGERTPSEPGGPTVNQPGALSARYEWVLDGWVEAQPAGQATVLLTWAPPTGWRGEPFRVYGRRAGTGSHRLMATVTACAEGLCRYVDPDITQGQRYEYYVAVVDERAGREVTTPNSVSVQVPTYTRPPRPAAPSVVPLDNLAYVHWDEVNLPADRIWKYMVFMERRDRTELFQPGETDGIAFVDGLARNGLSYRYAVAAVDVDGHVSDRGPWSEWRVPRPDYHAELIYAYGDSVPRSGFRFPQSDTADPIRSGNATDAQWRFEVDASGWRLRPLGGTGVLDAGFTTALTCGVGADSDCISVDRVPETGYGTAPLALATEHTYALRLVDGGATRYAKLRVSLFGTDQNGRRFMVFDWAYQTVPDVRNLNVGW